MPTGEDPAADESDRARRLGARRPVSGIFARPLREVRPGRDGSLMPCGGRADDAFRAGPTVVTPPDLRAEAVRALFTRSDGAYLFARWGRPIATVVFGVEDASLPVLKGAVEATARLAGVGTADADPELGANLMVFFVRGWSELAGVPNLDRLIPDLDALLGRLEAADANQYRVFRFDAAGAIRAAFVLLRMDEHLSAAVPAETLALSQAVQTILLWSDAAFGERSPLLAVPGRGAVLRPEIGDVIRAAYDPVLPAHARDPAHALRLAARLGRAS